MNQVRNAWTKQAKTEGSKIEKEAAVVEKTVEKKAPTVTEQPKSDPAATALEMPQEETAVVFEDTKPVEEDIMKQETKPVEDTTKSKPVVNYDLESKVRSCIDRGVVTMQQFLSSFFYLLIVSHRAFLGQPSTPRNS